MESPAITKSLVLALVAACVAMGALVATRLARGEADDRFARRLRGVCWTTFAIPLIWLFLFAALVVRARSRLGFWPLPQGPDPSQLFPRPISSPVGYEVFGIHRDLLMWGVMVVALCTFFAAGVFLGSIRLRATQRFQRTLAAHVAAYSVFWFVWIGDPWGFSILLFD